MTTKQYKVIGCLDVDPKGECAFMIRAETEEEILRLCSEHGKFVHNIDVNVLPPEKIERFKSAIKTVKLNF